MLSHEIPLALPIYPSQVDCALSLDKPNYLRYRIFGRNRDQHVYVIWHQMAFLNSAFLLLRQLSEYLAQVPSQFHIQRLSSALRYKNYVILALPSCMT